MSRFAQHPVRQSLLAATLTGVGILLLASQAASQAVYGVRRTAVAPGPTGTTVVAKSTTVAPGPLPPPLLAAGYIAVLPNGYRAVVVSGMRYYAVGGVYYKPQFYQG